MKLATQGAMVAANHVAEIGEKIYEVKKESDVKWVTRSRAVLEICATSIDSHTSRIKKRKRVY